MPLATALMVRASWTWFAAGLLLGALMVVARLSGHEEIVWLLRTAHIHILLVGFGAQWIMGIAHWIYPRRVASHEPRAQVRALRVWLFLNLGVALRLVAEPALLATGATWTRAAFAAAVGLQVVAGGLFLTLLRGRVWCLLRLRDGYVREASLRRALRIVLKGEEWTGS
ncbi:MAG: hypothetical protein HY608_11650 [Planctomycetes bacterium]|nr:hypothetical protein [Planctomycetota bacterium]